MENGACVFDERGIEVIELTDGQAAYMMDDCREYMTDIRINTSDPFSMRVRQGFTVQIKSRNGYVKLHLREGWRVQARSISILGVDT